MVFAILTVYRVLLLGVLVVGSPWWLWRMATSGRYRAGLWGRLGFVPAGLREACSGSREQGAGNSGRGWVWLHAVSVGEVLAAAGIVRGLATAGFRVAVSTTTEAGQELARERFVGCPVFYMPLDFGWLMGRYLQVIRPKMVVTMESELWPNLIHACKARAVPLAVVNARVSDRSFPRYMRLRRAWGPLLREVSLFLAQSQETAGRLRTMGVNDAHVRVLGNLKYDVAVRAYTARSRSIAAWMGGMKAVVAGSTLQGEEELLLTAWAGVVRAIPRTVLVIAPRHKNRFDQVFGMVRETGFPVFRASELKGAAEAVGGAVLLLDTIGDLASLYGLGTVAFVGGSLVAKGGHNPLEAARFGVPVVMGESWFNFKDIVGALLAADALQIVKREELGRVVETMLRDGDGGMGERGRRVFEAQAGATGRTVAALLEMAR